MGWRFWRRIRVLPGVTINLSKTGISTSFGPRGLKFTVGPRGTRTTVGLPGTGLFYTEVNKAPATEKPTEPGGISFWRLLLFIILLGLVAWYVLSAIR